MTSPPHCSGQLTVNQLLGKFARDERGIGAVEIGQIASLIAVATFGLLHLIADRQFNDPRQWRTRASEARDLARQMADTDAMDGMTRIAEEYDFLAEQAEQRRRNAIKRERR
jgi:hypothetical protein